MPSEAGSRQRDRSHLVCGHCDKQFARAENLARHQAAYRKNLKFVCHCGKKFGRGDVLRRHEKTHNREQVSAALNLDRTTTPSRGTTQHEIQDLPSIIIGNQNQIDETEPSSVQLQHDPDIFHSGVDLYSYDDAFFDGDLTWALDFEPDAFDFEHDPISTVQSQSSTKTASDVHVHTHAQQPLRGWPDRASRHASPAAQVQQGAQSEDAAVQELCSEIAQLHDQISDQHSTVVLPVSSQLSDRLARVCTSADDPVEHNAYGGMMPFLEPSAIQYFINLFFTHIQPRYPVIHMPTFSIDKAQPVLLLAMILSGSTMSQCTKPASRLLLFTKLYKIISLECVKDINFTRDSENTFALLLISSFALGSGDKLAYERSEASRGTLVLACKRRRLLDCRSAARRNSHDKAGIQALTRSWHAWIQTEQRKRLGICIYMFDCQFAALLNMQPFISKAETVHAVLPCPDQYWIAPSAQTWKIYLGTSDTPSCAYFLTTLNSLLLSGTVQGVLPFPSLDTFSRTLMIYVIYTHVFEWRQTLCMINPNGLVRSVLAFAPQDIGPGLMERKTWLSSALENWNRHYGTRNPSLDESSSQYQPIAQLLHHLAQLALQMSFSDLHMVTGRSGSEEDIFLAEESLRNWLRLQESESSVFLAMEMLELAHKVVKSEMVGTWSLELAVCLFSGGLICWTWCRLRDSSNRETQLVDGILLNHIQRSAKALSGLWQCRLGAFFSSVLGYFHQDLASRASGSRA